MHKINIKCPNCQKKIFLKVYDVIDESKIPFILDESLFKVKCKNCNSEIRIDYPLELELNNYVILYNVKDNKFDKKIRITETFDDFKEKVLIFSDNYNDIIIEFIKAYIRRNLNLEDKVLRYDSCNEENIIFTIIDDYKNVGIPIVFYNDLLKKAKLKDNSIINSDNYIRFIKL